MNLSAPFIRRPVATTLLTFAVLLSGIVSYRLLPVSPLPQVEFPTIAVTANLPGASPMTMASAVATPLERQFARIAGVSEMSSVSGLGSTTVTLQFDLDRDVHAAARDVQAAINAARSHLPPNLPNNPSYRLVNPSDAPIMMLTLASDIYRPADLFDVMSTILEQKVAQVNGVGQVRVVGGSLPAVRVHLNPTVMTSLGVGLGEVRQTLSNANANRPKGQIESEDQHWTITATDQLFKAEEYESLIVAYRNGAPIRLKDLGEVIDSVENVQSFGSYNGLPSVSMLIHREPGANILETVKRIEDLIPQMKAQIPAAVDLYIPFDRTGTIRASLHDVQFTLMLSVFLVIMVVFVFLRDFRTTLIPTVAVPVSLIGTFGVMYLLGYSLDNLSLMALTIATGFVVDDAIVVVENIRRHIEAGMSPRRAAFRGAREIGFTVVSISISLVAVFIPILMMSGIVGRLFREFAITLSTAIGISLLVSLTTTPMMCAILLKPKSETRHGWLYRASEKIFDWILYVYDWSLSIVLRHQRITMAVTLSTIAFTIYLYVIIPKGFFPQQDVGRFTGNLVADQDISYQAMTVLTNQYIQKTLEDPDVVSISAFSGGRSTPTNNSRMFITLKQRKDRSASITEIAARLRKAVGTIPGGSLYLQPIQDLRIGGRPSSAQYQYTLQGSDLEELNAWSPKLLSELRKIPGMVDINSDQQNRGLEARLEVNRLTAARLGLTFQQIDDVLYDAFGQRLVSTIYTAGNQYRVVMGLEPQYWENPESLKLVYIKNADGGQIPLSDLYEEKLDSTSLSVPHSGQWPAVTISFNLSSGTSLSDVVPKIEEAVHQLGLPATIQGRFQGTAQAFQSSTRTQPALILAALVAVYLVLGMLYESYLHPITILSTIPSAGVGALLSLMWCNTELNMMALIGILLLIGIVKKNAIIMIDFAIEAERERGLDAQSAIYEACLLRFRPITMTTMAALLGGLPLALGTGDGSELRHPLGIAIVGGLIFSQMLTLYTTPVVYLYVDWLQEWRKKRRLQRSLLREQRRKRVSIPIDLEPAHV
ncbi:MAG TPA: multidrug efflux RND transporter permease subunit [Planctomicrobium sp.]|nr:multidrug efflux RND transporter permease subunit [Planctomicrobium sp.]